MAEGHLREPDDAAGVAQQRIAELDHEAGDDAVERVASGHFACWDARLRRADNWTVLFGTILAGWIPVQIAAIAVVVTAMIGYFAGRQVPPAPAQGEEEYE